jgi:hypothetical protein
MMEIGPSSVQVHPHMRMEPLMVQSLIAMSCGRLQVGKPSGSVYGNFTDLTSIMS